MKNKIFYVFIALGMVTMISCFVIGGMSENKTVMLAGFGFCFVDFVILGIIRTVCFFKELNKQLKEEAKKERTPEREQELLDEINSSGTVEENQIAQAKYYGQGAENAGELIQACFGFTKEAKENYRQSSKKDKFKVVAVYGTFALLLFIMFVGVALSNAGKTPDGSVSPVQLAGFILMGVGGGGFFLVIFVLVMISVAQRKRYLSLRKKGLGDAAYKAELCEGTVLYGAVHSQYSTGSRINRVYGTLYQIMVVPDSGKKNIHFVCSRLYKKGDKVKFYRYKNNKCILVEE